MNVLKPKQKKKEPIEQKRILHPADIPPKLIKQQHIEDMVIKVGDIADRPSDDSTHIRAYFAKDESKLYIWNSDNSAWESVTLS